MRISHHIPRLAVLASFLAFAACTTTPVVMGDPASKGVTAVSDGSPNATRGTVTAADANIRSSAVVNAKSASNAVPAPANKAPGAASKQGSYNTCSVRFDSRNRLYVETYVDGRPTGMLGPWGDVYTYAVAGPTRLYARATFDDGSVTTWGPVTVSCPAGGSYTWRLTYTE